MDRPEDAMSGSRLLQWKLALARSGPVAWLAMLLCAAGIAAWLWYLPQAQRAASMRAAALAPAAAQAPVAALVSAAGPEQNLAQFYATLGDKGEVEQQLKTIFGLASKSGLTLTAGQYHASHDQNGRFHTYQVSLPVKGNYHDVWQFSLQTLASVPFAALDEISIRRETIGEPVLEARVRFTLYLKDGVAKP
jgi:Tfp pilus assembly protein PilO